MSDPYMPVGHHVIRPRGHRACAHTLTGSVADDCGKDATWHIAWDGALNNSLSCDEHMTLAQRSWVYDDRHPVGADCNMPGALWSYRDGCCYVPPSGAQFAAAEAITAETTR